MIKFEEFAPKTYLDLNKGDILVTLDGVLEFIINSSYSFTDKTEDWDIDQFNNFLNKEKIDIIKADRSDCILAHNHHGQVIDNSADSARELSFINSKSILELIKLIQRGNNLSLVKGKEYKELMFEGFYLHSKKGKFYFNCDSVNHGFLNSPYSSQKNSANFTNEQFEQLAKENNFSIFNIDTVKIEFAQILKSNVASSQRQKSDSAYQPFNMKVAAKSRIKVIDGNGLLKLNII